MKEPTGKILILDDDEAASRNLKRLLARHSLACETFTQAEDLHNQWPEETPCCLILDFNQSPVNGYDILQAIKARELVCTIIFLTAHGDVPSAVAAMRSGAEDFLIKPCDPEELLTAVTRALEKACHLWRERRDLNSRQARASKLTSRERQVLSLAASGLVNKEIAAQLGVAEITVKIHRAHAMKRLGARTSAELAKFSAFLEIPPDVETPADQPTPRRQTGRKKRGYRTD